MDSAWLGIDPGGAHAFGVAMLSPNGQLRTRCVSCADEAIELICACPLGVGVDAPLWWSSGRSSDRVADKWIRKTYQIRSGTVQASNSLRGAALVQAVMFVYRLREKFPGVLITEAHPKAVAIALGGWGRVKLEALGSVTAPGQHERDAVLAAITAREGFEGRWTRDLSLSRNPSEQDPKAYWLSPVSYFWPDA